MAGGLGFEPRLAESESAVLPLDDPPNNKRLKYKVPHVTLPLIRRCAPPSPTRGEGKGKAKEINEVKIK